MPKPKPQTPQPTPLHSDYPLLTPQEAAAHLGICVATLRRWRHRKIGPQALVLEGKRLIRYRQEDIDLFLGKGVMAAADRPTAVVPLPRTGSGV